MLYGEGDVWRLKKEDRDDLAHVGLDHAVLRAALAGRMRAGGAQ